MTTPSNLYIPGLPSKPATEQIADGCLPRYLWGGRTVIRRLPKPVKYEDLHLMIKPILFEKEVTDYEITGPIPGLPTTKSKIANDILVQRKSIEFLETLIAEKSEQLRKASEQFLQDAKALNEESIPLISRSDDEYQ